MPKRHPGKGFDITWEEKISMSALQDDPKTVSNRIALHFGTARKV